MGKVLRKLLASGIISSWTAGKWFQKAKRYWPSKPEGKAGGRSFCTSAGCKEKGESTNYLTLWIRCPLNQVPLWPAWKDWPDLGKLWFAILVQRMECGQELSSSSRCPSPDWSLGSNAPFIKVGLQIYVSSFPISKLSKNILHIVPSSSQVFWCLNSGRIILLNLHKIVLWWNTLLSGNHCFQITLVMRTNTCWFH